MNKVRLGVIGLGMIGVQHVENVISGKCPELEIAAVSDHSPERRQWAKEKLPADAAIFDNASALMDSGKCNAVLISVPHYYHPELAIEAFSKGLHVMCEKPAGVYAKQVRQMNEAAEKSGLVFGMMFNQRIDPVYSKMRELVQSRELGALKRVNWIVTTWYRTAAYFTSAAWRCTWDGDGGGLLTNQCPHNFDLMQWICGMPSKMRAYCHNGKWHDIECEDDVTAYFEYPNGATGVFVTSLADYPGSNRLEITMDGGKLLAEDGKLRLWKVGVNEPEFRRTAPGGMDKPPVELIEFEAGENPRHVGILNSFAGEILHGIPQIAKGCEGINGVRIANAMHLSSWLDRMVDLPVDEDLFLAELNKRRRQPINN